MMKINIEENENIVAAAALAGNAVAAWQYRKQSNWPS